MTDDGNRGGRGGRDVAGKSPDLASDSRFRIRLFSNLVQLIASSVGERGGDITWLAGALDKLEESIGPAGMRGLAAVAAAGIQTPEAAKRVLRSLGMPEEYVVLADEAIDSFIHGLNFAQSKRGKVTEKDLNEATRDAQDKLASSLNRKVTFAEGLASLPPDQQIEFKRKYDELVAEDAAIKAVGKQAENKVAAAVKAAEAAAAAAGTDTHAAAGQARQNAWKSILAAVRTAAEAHGENPDDVEAMARGKFLTKREKFDALRAKVVGERVVVLNQIRSLIQIPSGDWVGYLEALYGPEKQSSGLAKLTGLADKTGKKLADIVGKKVDELTENPQAGMAKMAKGVDGLSDSVDGFLARMKARRLARGRRS